MTLKHLNTMISPYTPILGTYEVLFRRAKSTIFRVHLMPITAPKPYFTTLEKVMRECKTVASLLK